MEERTRRLVGLEDFAQYVGLGRNKALEFGRVSKCTVRFGRRILYDLNRADRYIDSMTECEDDGTQVN